MKNTDDARGRSEISQMGNANPRMEWWMSHYLAIMDWEMSHVPSTAPYGLSTVIRSIPSFLDDPKIMLHCF